MENEFWLKMWKENQIHFHRSEVNEQLVKYFSKLDLKKGDTVFVPLCGKSLDMLWLMRKGLKIIAVELSAKAIEDFFSENGLDYQKEKFDKFVRYESPQIEIYEGDFFDLTPNLLKKVKCVYDRASMVALPMERRAQYTEHMKALIPKHLKSLLITYERQEDKNAGPPFHVPQDEVEKLYRGYHCQLLETEHLPLADEEHMARKVFLIS